MSTEGKPREIIVTIEDSEQQYPSRDFTVSWPDNEMPLDLQSDNARMLFSDAIQDYLGEHNPYVPYEDSADRT